MHRRGYRSGGKHRLPGAAPQAPIPEPDDPVAGYGRGQGARPSGAVRPLPARPQQQPEPVLEDVDHVGGEAAVRLAAEVGDVDRDPPARLEHPHALGEHVVQQLEVLEVRARHTVALELLALEVATLRGLDPDMPRNLAKSVTVE